MVRILAAVLVAQIAVVALLYWPVSADLAPREALLPIEDVAAVNRLQISDGESIGVQLTRDATGWKLASGLPADDSKAEGLLTALAAQDPGYAIAQTPAAASRFSVSDGDFERRITVTTADQSAVAFLGSSPAFQKIHARADGDAKIFVLPLNSYDAPTTEGEWLDRRVLAQPDLDAIAVGNAQLTLEGGAWTRADGKDVDAEAIATLVQVLAGLQVSGISDDDAQQTAVTALELRTSGGERPALELTVLKNTDEERYYLRADRYAQTFDTSSFDAERLIEAAETLLEQ